MREKIEIQAKRLCGKLIPLLENMPEDSLFPSTRRIQEEYSVNRRVVFAALHRLEKENLIRIFIYGDMNDKIDRAVRYYGLKLEGAQKAIQKNDRERALHYKHYTDQEWADKSNYDLCINSGLIGAEKTAELICAMINENYTRRNGNV